MIKTKLIFGLLFSVLFLLMPLGNYVASADPFDPNQIASDAIFNNMNTMNAAQIDAWVNASYGAASCISTDHGFTAPDPDGYNPTNGFLYGSNVTAGQVIYDAAQAYQINPQVLLVTLQKEQGLVSGTGPYGCSANAYSAAAGYGCPDGGPAGGYNYTNSQSTPINLGSINGVQITSVTGTCVNTYLKAGFSQQVIRAAWLLKFGEERSEGNIGWAIISGSWDNSDDLQSCYSGPMTAGTFHRCPGDTAISYDGTETIDGTTVYMDDGATAALYWYTPHLNGNENFYNIFTSWFGNPSLVCTSDDTPGPQVLSLYNPTTYQHFYTALDCEANIVSYLQGYQREGAVYNTTDPSTPGATPVYRLYQASTGVHFWTTSQNEITADEAQGYTLEGIAFDTLSPNNTNGSPTYPVYRFYNPSTYQHVWSLVTSSPSLTAAGYHFEGIAFYSQ